MFERFFLRFVRWGCYLNHVCLSSPISAEISCVPVQFNFFSSAVHVNPGVQFPVMIRIGRPPQAAPVKPPEGKLAYLKSWYEDPFKWCVFASVCHLFPLITLLSGLSAVSYNLSYMFVVFVDYRGHSSSRICIVSYDQSDATPFNTNPIIRQFFSAVT